MKFLTKIRLFFKKALGSGPGFIKDHSMVAVIVTNQLKKIVQGQLDNKIAASLPGTWAPELVAYLETVIPKVATQVSVAHAILHIDPKQANAVALVVEELKKLSKPRMDKYLQDFAARLNHYLADGEISVVEAWEEAQEFYRDFIKKK